MKKTAGIFPNQLVFDQKRTTNIGKSGPNKNNERISEQKQTLFEEDNEGNINFSIL